MAALQLRLCSIYFKESQAIVSKMSSLNSKNKFQPILKKIKSWTIAYNFMKKL